MSTEKVVFITGAARRVGAVIAKILHQQGFNLIIHYNHSEEAAQQLCDELNQKRSASAKIIKANLLQTSKLSQLVQDVANVWGRLDVLINNASTFYPTPLGQITEQHWDDLFGVNLKAPLFLSQAAASFLRQQKGSIINIVDIHGFQPLKDYNVYGMAKAGLIMMTKVLAKELGPDVRVNAVAPGPILWPEDKNELDEVMQNKIINRTLLKKMGSPEEVALAVKFFIQEANYITGQVLPVDGGRSLNF